MTGQADVSTPYLIRRLIREHVAHYGRKIAFATLCMVVVAGATAANAWMMQPVLDKIFIEKDRSLLALLPLAVLAIAVTSALANYGQTLTMRFVGQRIVADMQKRLFAHLITSDLALFHDQSPGRLISRFTNDIHMMRTAVSNALTTLAKELLTMVFLVGVMFYQSVELSCIALFVFPVAIYPVMRLGRRMRSISRRTQRELGDFTARLDETFQGARTVKAYVREPFEIKRAGALIEALFTLYFKSSRVQAAASPMMEALSGISIASVIWYGGFQVLDGVTTPGAFFSFVAAFLMAYKPVRTVAGLNTSLQEGLAAASRYFEALDAKPQIIDAPDARPLVVPAGFIRYANVTFRYPHGGRGVENITLDIHAGKMAALVGLSGGGKSTIMNLLLRFYEADSGDIAIDGQDIRGVTLASLREAMAFVPQEPVLFDDTVRANIAYGKLDASEAQIVQAAQGAAADDFIRALPQGYDTMIGAGGVRLSGGQKQRIAIARAMLKDAPILLLDEATSALDNESERAVQQALAKLTQNRTTLVIAHRLSTIIHADVIYVIDGGRVVEHGTHNELLANGGRYHQLYAEHAWLEV